MKKLSILSTFALLSFAALATVNAEVPSGVPALFNTKWKLEAFFSAEKNTFEKPNNRGYDSAFVADSVPEDAFTLEFSGDSVVRHEGGEYQVCRGRLAYALFWGLYSAGYANSTIEFEVIIRPNKIADPPDGERYDRALYLSRTFELRDTYLKMYYGDKNDYLLFRPWGRSAVSSADNAVSQTESGTEVTVTGRDIVLAGGEFVAGPNPVSKSAGFVNFYRDGKQVRRASLRVYNASGRSVGKINIKDGGKPADGQVLSRRRVGSWDLKDAKGRPVSEGTYLVKGTLKAGGRTVEKIALLISVR